MTGTFDVVDLRLRPGISPAEAGVPEPVGSVEHADGMRIERNRAIALADGVEIFADLFLPERADDVPALIAWGPYGKHNGGNVYKQFKDDSGRQGGGVRPEWISAHTTFEGPDPKRWCEQGYAVVNVDPRGRWWSGGDYATMWDAREARDCGDVIAWAAAEPWSNGKVGMSGVSYLAVSQWWAASLRPPALAAINPCEGLSDPYREFAFHGGIPSDFPAFLQSHRMQYTRSKAEALADMMEEHLFDDAYWATKRPALEDVEVPAFVIASWSDQGLHTRGTLEAFDRLGSAWKHLEVHGRKKWEHYHSPATVDRTRAFFDHFLKGVDNGVDAWPAVRMETRRAFYDGVERRPSTWPPAETELRTLHLDAEHESLGEAAPTVEASARYVAEDGGAGVAFEHVFDATTDIVGGMALRLWVEADGGDDMDLFVAVKKVGRDGELVDFPFANVLERGPVALGWLRVSQRASDPERSTPNRPWHPHAREQLLAPGEVVSVDVEIWPSATRFEAGEALRLELLPGDPYPGALLWRHTATRNRGTHVVHAGGRYDAHLVLPVVPVEPDAPSWESPDV